MKNLTVVPWMLDAGGVKKALGYNVIYRSGGEVRIIKTFYEDSSEENAGLAKDAAEAYAESLTCWRRIRTRFGFTAPHWKAGYVFFAEEGPDSDTAFDEVTRTRHVVPNIEVVT